MVAPFLTQPACCYRVYHRGLNETSTLHAVMTEAIEKGFYDVEGYEEMLGRDDHNRVLLQEFGCANTTLYTQRSLSPPPPLGFAVTPLTHLLDR
eukprot:COSAG06_NODE_6487_length_2912_cov_3.283683_4_plen_94_part_00